MVRPARRARPFPVGKRQAVVPSHYMPAGTECLRRVLRRYQDDGPAIHPGLLLKLSEQDPPAGIADCFCKAVVLQHVPDLQVFRRDQVLVFDQAERDPVQVVVALTGNPPVQVRELFAGLLIVPAAAKPASFRFGAFRPSGHPALRPADFVFHRGAEPRVNHDAAVRVVHKRQQVQVDAGHKL